MGSVGRVGGLEEEREEGGPRAGGELALGDLGDDTGDGVADGSGLLVGDDLEELGLDAITDLDGLLCPDLASALCETLPQLDGGELTDGEVGRGGEDLEEGRDALRVLVVVVLERLGSCLDSVGVGDVALLEELVKPLNERGLYGIEQYKTESGISSCSEKVRGETAMRDTYIHDGVKVVRTRTLAGG